MILTAQGQPAAPSGVVERLQEIDPQLDLLLLNIPHEGETLQWWGIVREWDPGDPRWSQVQTGEIPRKNARDMVCQLPLDCTPEQAVGFLINGYRGWGGREDYLKALRRVDDWNARQQQRFKDEAKEFAREEASKAAHDLQGVTKVFQNDKRTKRAR